MRASRASSTVATRAVDLALQVATNDASAGWEAGLGGPTSTVWRGPLTVRAAAKGGPEALGLQVSDGAGGCAGLEAGPTVDLTTGRWHGAVTLRHPGARRFVNAVGLGPALGLTGPGRWLGDGSFALVAQMSGEPGRVSADRFDLRAGALHTGGTLDVGARGSAPRLDGQALQPSAAVAGLRPALGRSAAASGTCAAGRSPCRFLPSRAFRSRSKWQTKLRATLVWKRGCCMSDGFHAGVQRRRDHRGGARSTARRRRRPRLLMPVGAGSPSRPAMALPLVTFGRADGTADLTATGYSPATLLATAARSVRLHVRGRHTCGRRFARPSARH